MPRRVLLLILASALAAMATGCTSKTAEESTIPWSRPASWEGGIPGMGNPGGTR